MTEHTVCRDCPQIKEITKAVELLGKEVDHIKDNQKSIKSDVSTLDKEVDRLGDLIQETKEFEARYDERMKKVLEEIGSIKDILGGLVNNITKLSEKFIANELNTTNALGLSKDVANRALGAIGTILTAVIIYVVTTMLGGN